MNSINHFLNDPSTSTSAISELRNYHPLFMKLTYKGAGIVFRHGDIVDLKSYQILFKEGMAESAVFVVLYGRAIVRTAKGGVLGLVGIGESVGEEAMFMPKYEFR
eukprot:TRINITY_DN6510_c0_g1_i2.p1 TRINITY_DN6510_c0_g1~~TRINITY_DN6510_c0_g1_i2.p1  ORF type:complete len:105 (-),score=28.71 TRINITY_DN6510_c0_g1_i2:308-622(-)